MTDHVELTIVTLSDCEPCAMAQALAHEIVRQNSVLAIEVRSIDVDGDPRGVREIGAMAHPTLVLSIGGEERVRLSNTMSKRRVLRKLLPILYPDESTALRELRRQLGSSTETFSRGPRRGRVRQAEKVDLLREVPLFGELGRRHVAQLARLVDEVDRGEGERLIEEGEPGDEFFIVVEGAVGIRRGRRHVATLGPGDCFGEMSLLDDQPRSATATTRSPTTLLVIHRADFDRMLATDPSIMRVMLTTLSRRLRA